MVDLDVFISIVFSCYCSNTTLSVYLYQSVNLTNCGKTCPANVSQYCGSSSSVNFYTLSNITSLWNNWLFAFFWEDIWLLVIFSRLFDFKYELLRWVSGLVCVHNVELLWLPQWLFVHVDDKTFEKLLFKKFKLWIWHLRFVIINDI